MMKEDLEIDCNRIVLVRQLSKNKGARVVWVVEGEVDHAERGRVEQDSQGYRWRLNNDVGDWVATREEAQTATAHEMRGSQCASILIGATATAAVGARCGAAQAWRWAGLSVPAMAIVG